MGKRKTKDPLPTEQDALSPEGKLEAVFLSGADGFLCESSLLASAVEFLLPHYTDAGFVVLSEDDYRARVAEAEHKQEAKRQRDEAVLAELDEVAIAAEADRLQAVRWPGTDGTADH